MLAPVTPVKTQRGIMELEKLTHTGEEAGEFLDTIHPLADGDRFRDEPTTFIREVGISDTTLAAALRELGTAKLTVGTMKSRRKEYTIFEPLQPLQPLQPVYPLQGLQKSCLGNKNSAFEPSQRLQPIYNILRGLRRSHPGNRDPTFADLQSLQSIYNTLQRLQKSHPGNRNPTFALLQPIYSILQWLQRSSPR